MKRRSVLIGVSMAVLGGCSSAGDLTPTPTETPPQVTLSARGVEPKQPDATLQVDYAAGVAMQTPSDPPTAPDDGMKFVFVAMRITNSGEGEYQVTGAPFVLQAGGKRYGIVVTKHADELRWRTLQAGESTTGWLMYQLPYTACHRIRLTPSTQ